MPESKQFWDKRAKKYDAKIVKGSNYAARLERVDNWLDDSANVLDVGCASGEITLDLAPHVGQILGIDVSPKMTEIANRRAHERGIENARFNPYVPEDPNLAEESFDGITMYSVIHVYGDPPASLRRLHDLLNRDGLLITETPCLGSWFFGWRLVVKLALLFRLVPLVHSFSVAELESMITDAGFEVVESKVYNPKSRMQCILARKQ